MRPKEKRIRKPLLNEKYMGMAINLAKKGTGKTSPNPLVGAVIVKDGQIIGKGYHKKAGDEHAEITALKKAGAKAENSELYVNLEPCCHFGKTPPCTDAILRSKIKKVTIGMLDPNPLVAGKGISALRGGGVTVEVGLLEEDCRRLNEVFIKYISTGKPFVILKAAASLDGKTATCKGDSRWISNEFSRNMVHQLRNQVDGIMVGIETVIKDDPLLTTRLKKGKGKDPIRIIVDTHLRISSQAKVFNPDSEAKTIVAVGEPLQKNNVGMIEEAGGIILPVKTENNQIDLAALMAALGKMEITSVMIEGGARINASALRDKIIDKILIFFSPRIIGGSEASGIFGGEGIASLKESTALRNLHVRRLRGDFLMEGYLKN